MDEEPDSGDSGNYEVGTLTLKKPAHKRDISKGLKETKDLEGILLEPNLELNELAVMNPSLHQDNQEGPWPFVYRTEIPDSSGGRISVIKYDKLEAPNKLQREPRIIISPEFPWESKGCEDPRLTKVRDSYFITYTAWDGLNARIAYTSTKDFKKFKKHKLIGLNIELNLATSIVGNKMYKELWEKEWKERFNALEDKSQPIYLWDKDAVLDYDNKNQEWILPHRWDPCMLIARAKKIKDFEDNNYCIDYLKNINQHIVMIPGKNKKKVGWGSTPFNLGDKKMNLIHEVYEDKRRIEHYFGWICELDDSYKIVSIVPLLEPGEDDLFEYFENGSKKHKKVIFPTAGLVQNNGEKRLWIYSGSGDKKIKYRTTNIDWLYREANHQHNRDAAKELTRIE